MNNYSIFFGSILLAALAIIVASMYI
jgi:hypothetical protein